ncbi:MAG: ATP-grasp domain-containing protein [Oscillospiraceae bacterium]|nr:ATP-grasp domain-containing protein [Oscillospiraceae bacterium]
MKNFVFISPNFPDNYWLFCRRLRENGLRVLGIGDSPYDNLAYELKESLDEYYKVSSLENYDEVYRAVAFYIHKYGRIDWLESNNEYWLERDADLRKDFNILSGFQPEDMPSVKFKSKMKEKYKLAGVPVARYHLVDNRENCKKFIDEVGYPVIVKPDNGVGATRTYKLSSDEDLDEFFGFKDDTLYIMEEFIDATVNTYDAIVNSAGVPLFETGNVTAVDLMQVVLEQGNSCFYIRDELPDELRSVGRAALKAFGVHSRFVHFEFFRLNRDQHIGKKGDIVALEVNMRPSGGISPSMMNYANGTDVYKIWADMIAFDRTEKGKDAKQNCVFTGRRDARNYVLRREDVLNTYGDHVVEEGRVGAALTDDMGDYYFLSCFKSLDEMNDFVAKVFEEE